MNTIVLALVEIVSAMLCFVLLRFMIKPYRGTGEGRYLGLPLGFGLLGASYILTAASLFLGSFLFVSYIKWFQIFTQTYAFAFLAATYYFSKKPTKNTRLLWNVTYAALVVAIVASFTIVVVPPQFELPSYETANQYLLLSNIIFLAYISIHTIRSHVSNPMPGTIWIPFAYLLLGFSQYSLLIWSIDSGFSAYIGAYFLRLSSLLIFLFVTYRSFHLSAEGVLDEKAPT